MALGEMMRVACTGAGVLVGNGNEDIATDGQGGKAQLFALFIEGPGADRKWDLGRDYVRLSTNTGSIKDRNGAFSPSAVDLDDNGTVDRVYVGDLYSNLWAFHVANRNTARWKLAYGKPLFSASSGKTKTKFPITVRPLVTRPTQDVLGSLSSPSRARMTPKGGLTDQGLMVYFGTGRFFAADDKTLFHKKQAFYGIHDRGIGGLRPDRLVKQSFVGGVRAEGRVTQTGLVVNCR